MYTYTHLLRRYVAHLKKDLFSMMPPHSLCTNCLACVVSVSYVKFLLFAIYFFHSICTLDRLYHMYIEYQFYAGIFRYTRNQKENPSIYSVRYICTQRESVQQTHVVALKIGRLRCRRLRCRHWIERKKLFKYELTRARHSFSSK